MARRVSLRDAALTRLCLAFAWLTRILPLPLARALTIGLGRVAYWLVPRVRRVGLANLDAAYGNALTPAQKRRVLLGALDNVARVGAEFSRIPQMAARRFAGIGHVRGLEHLPRNSGVLLVAGHLGNWEWMAPLLAAQGLRVAEVVRPLNDPALDHFVESTREAGGIATIPKYHAGNELMQRLRDGWIVGILIDQSPRESAVPVHFFGQPCWATAGPVLIARRAKVPVHMARMIREPGGGYCLEIGPAVPMQQTGDLQADLAQNSQRLQDDFEQLVRAQPEQWLWLHRRWKARPALQAAWDKRAARTRQTGPAPQG